MRGADCPWKASAPLFQDGSSPHAWGRSSRGHASACPRPVHPHMRGADVRARFRPRRPRRFIPTCVGQIITRPCVSVSTAGSSPHAWGRCKSAFSTSTSTTVHPHMRGADVSAFCTISMIQRFIPTCVGADVSCRPTIPDGGGSSPHAWGRWPRARARRIWTTVHPHMRGADALETRALASAVAVHPHMRGADLIPARRLSSLCSVHPHMRGADGCDYRLDTLRITVHPHMRGADAVCLPD